MQPHEDRFWSKYYKIRYGNKIAAGQTKAEIDLILSSAPLKENASILDFTCGYGRHATELGKLGYKIDGFDIDQGSIDEGMNKVRSENLGNVNLWVDDSRTFKSKKKYDLSICMYTSLGFFNDEENKLAYKNLFSSVKKGGYVILDIMNRNWAIKNCTRYKELELTYNGETYKITHHRDILRDPWREHNHLSFLNKDTMETAETSYSLQLYEFNEILKLVNEHGHRLIAGYGDYDKATISDTLQRFIFVTQKI